MHPITNAIQGRIAGLRAGPVAVLIKAVCRGYRIHVTLPVMKMIVRHVREEHLPTYLEHQGYQLLVSCTMLMGPHMIHGQTFWRVGGEEYNLNFVLFSVGTLLF